MMNYKIISFIFIIGTLYFHRDSMLDKGISNTNVIIQIEEESDIESKHVYKVFREIEAAVSSNTVNPISTYLHKQVYINLPGVEGGYFSGNQAVYILQNYFATHKIINFKFSKIRVTGISPFATGGGSYMVKGKQEILQIYVGLTKQSGQWAIAQFNVY